MTILYTLPKDVFEAAQLLDQVEPGWEYNISIQKLEMESCCNCILGQLFGHYHRAFINLFGEDAHYDLLRVPCDYINPFGNDTYNEWVEQIKVRLADRPQNRV